MLLIIGMGTHVRNILYLSLDILDEFCKMLNSKAEKAMHTSMYDLSPRDELNGESSVIMGKKKSAIGEKKGKRTRADGEREPESERGGEGDKVFYCRSRRQRPPRL